METDPTTPETPAEEKPDEGGPQPKSPDEESDEPREGGGYDNGGDKEEGAA